MALDGMTLETIFRCFVEAHTLMQGQRPQLAAIGCFVLSQGQPGVRQHVTQDHGSATT